MKELLNVFKPEISPIHKVGFSIAAQMKVAGTKAEGVIIPAGTALVGDFLADPVANVATIATATGAALTGVLMHDVVLEAGTDLVYSVGVMIEGVVYDDVMKSVNAWYVAADAVALSAVGVKTYGVKTIGKTR
jgi:hypothetical protein